MNTDENTGHINPPAEEKIQGDHAPKQRGLGLSVLLIFSMVYNGIFLLIFIAGFFYNNIFQEVLQLYYKQNYISKPFTFLINIGAALIFSVSFYGLILLWKFKKKGFYYFAVAQALILNTLVVFLKSYDWINIAVAVMIIVILGFSSRNMD